MIFPYTGIRTVLNYNYIKQLCLIYHANNNHMMLCSKETSHNKFSKKPTFTRL